MDLDDCEVNSRGANVARVIHLVATTGEANAELVMGLERFEGYNNAETSKGNICV